MLKRQHIVNMFYAKDFSYENKKNIDSSIYVNKVVHINTNNHTEYVGEILYIDDVLIVIKDWRANRRFIMMDKIESFWLDEEAVA